MKREDLIKLGIAEDLVDKIMAQHGSDIESHKTKLTTTQADLDAVKKQLTDANTAIEGFKKLDPEALQKAVDEWKTKAEQAQTEAQKQLQALKFDHALEAALTGAKAKNGKAVRALLNLEGLKLNETDGSIIGLNDQLSKIKTENDYLFEGETGDPHIVTGTNSKSTLTDPVILAARKAAGLPEGK